MSWSNVRPFFNNIMDTQEFTLWPDGFNFENIPANIVDGSYHVTITALTSTSNNQWDLETLVPVQVRFFLKGYNDPIEAIDTAIIRGEGIVKAVCKPSARTLETCIQNVSFIDFEINPLSDSNDNAVLAQLNFEARVILQTEE